MAQVKNLTADALAAIKQRAAQKHEAPSATKDTATTNTTTTTAKDTAPASKPTVVATKDAASKPLFSASTMRSLAKSAVSGPQPRMVHLTEAQSIVNVDAKLNAKAVVAVEGDLGKAQLGLDFQANARADAGGFAEKGNIGAHARFVSAPPLNCDSQSCTSAGGQAKLSYAEAVVGGDRHNARLGVHSRAEAEAIGEVQIGKDGVVLQGGASAYAAAAEVKAEGTTSFSLFGLTVRTDANASAAAGAIGGSIGGGAGVTKDGFSIGVDGKVALLGGLGGVCFHFIHAVFILFVFD